MKSIITRHIFKHSLLLVLYFIFINASAQDYKFAQYFNSPLNLNPALTGKINSEYRFIANYRMQYFTVQSPSPYTTIAASADFGLLRKKLNQDILGIGILFGNDRQTILRTNKLNLSIAYHKGMGRGKKHYLSAGFQVGFLQRQIDLNNLYFASQFTGDEFDLSKPNLEQIDRNKFIKPEINIGLLWSSLFNKDKIGIYAGISIFNTLQPKYSFLSSNYEREFRYNAHAGASIQIKKFMMILPNTFFTMQNKNLNWNIGANLAFNLSEKRYAFTTSGIVGFFYDGNGLITTNLGLQYKNILASVSYDANIIKDINKAVNSVGGLEVSLIYSGKPVNQKVNMPLFCPKF